MWGGWRWIWTIAWMIRNCFCSVLRMTLGGHQVTLCSARNQTGISRLQFTSYCFPAPRPKKVKKIDSTFSGDSTHWLAGFSLYVFSFKFILLVLGHKGDQGPHLALYSEFPPLVPVFRAMLGGTVQCWGSNHYVKRWFKQPSLHARQATLSLYYLSSLFILLLTKTGIRERLLPMVALAIITITPT